MLFFMLNQWLFLNILHANISCLIYPSINHSVINAELNIWGLVIQKAQNLMNQTSWEKKFFETKLLTKLSQRLHVMKAQFCEDGLHLCLSHQDSDVTSDTLRQFPACWILTSSSHKCLRRFHCQLSTPFSYFYGHSAEAPIMKRSVNLCCRLGWKDEFMYQVQNCVPFSAISVYLIMLQYCSKTYIYLTFAYTTRS
jgi:hypothetical protein